MLQVKVLLIIFIYMHVLQKQMAQDIHLEAHHSASVDSIWRVWEFLQVYIFCIIIIKKLEFPYE